MQTTFDVKGMHCEGCEGRIKTALRKFPEITGMEVDHRRNLVRIEYQHVDLDAVTKAMTRMGFQVTSA